ncbi:MAG: glycosyltransferase [Bacteriovoracia bacterium]
MANFYAKHAGLADAPYDTQSLELAKDAFGWADFWTNSLPKHGYEVLEIVANAQFAQRAWAREYVPRLADASTLTIATEQVKQVRPDILWICDVEFFGTDWVREIRAACPSIQLAIAWMGTPAYEGIAGLDAFDGILSCVPEIVTDLRKRGHRSDHLHHAFDARIYDRTHANAEGSLPLTFVGQVHREKGFHLRREELLLKLVNQVPLQLYSPSSQVNLKDIAKAYVKQAAYASAQALQSLGVSKDRVALLPGLKNIAHRSSKPLVPVDLRLLRFLRPGVFGLEMFQILRNSLVSLNVHIDASPRSASNMRLFEATGMGSCLLTEWRENLGELFTLDTEVVTYRSPEECREKARWLIDHPQDATRIGEAGRKRTLTAHQFQHRAPRLDQILKQWLP